MAKKAWEGRFKEKNDPSFEKMNRSLDFDIRLYKQDILLNKVYSGELSRIGVISKDEYESIKKGLDILENEIGEQGIGLFGMDIEDIHMGIENLLSEKIGDAAKKMHSGKSRNDQVATDIRMYLLAEVDEIIGLVEEFMSVIVDLSEKHLGIVMPGFTHLRQAQPVLFSHYMMSFFFSLERDIERLKDSVKRISILPLGNAALAGTGYPIDRENLKNGLNFDKVSLNSMDSVPSRDFILEFLSDISILSITLSRFAEDFILFSSDHLGFFELSDAVTTGSSIMPNKKNPDSLELTRGKTGRFIGNLMGLFTVLKGLPSTYNKDLQEDKEKLFDTADNIKDVLTVNIILLKSIKINRNKLESAIDPLSFATELADYLALNNMPFREAHQIVGKIVSDCIDKNIILTSLKEIDLVNYSDNFKGIADDWGKIEKFLERRNVTGGTGLKSVVNQIDYAKNFLKGK
jgi:argininosuccinate lyase